MARSRTSGVMRKPGFGAMMTAGLLSLTATLAHADRIVVFKDDFENPRLRTEWSGASIEQATDLTRFAGRMTTQPVDLKVSPPLENQAHQGRVTYYMRFDLFTLDGWTGKTADGKDMRFEVQVGEKLMFSHSLASLVGEGSFREASIGPKPMAFGSQVDSVYRGVQISFELAADEDLTVQFRALGLGRPEQYRAVSAALSGGDAPRSDEPAWGMDNVEIWCDYEHGGASSAGREAESPFVASPAAIAGGGGDPLQTQGASVPRPPLSTYKVPSPKELLPPGGGGSGGGNTPTTPFTPPENRPTPPELNPQTPDPDPKTPETPERPEDPKVPAPGVLGVVGIGLAATLRRKRAA